MAVNVYLHRQTELRAYLARLQSLAGHKPLLLAEAGADSIREGLDGQAAITAMHVRAAFEEGLCGAVAYAWTDEWWRGGQDVTDWNFGLVDADREPKPALVAVSQAVAEAPFSRMPGRRGRASRWWSAPTTLPTRLPTVSSRCRASTTQTTRSLSSTTARRTRPAISASASHRPCRRYTQRRTERGAKRRPGRGDRRNRRLHRRRYAGRSRLARSPGPAVPVFGRGRERRTERRPGRRPVDGASRGQGARWSDAGAARRPHRRARPRMQHGVPARCPPEIGGFNAIFLRAGDDVDACWRLQAKGGKIGFAAAAFVWHHHRAR